MKRKIVIQILACVLTASMVLGACGKADTSPKKQGGSQETSQESKTGKIEKNTEKAESVTVGELADYLIQAADDYRGEKDRKALTEGMDEKAQATRKQGLILLSRAFGELPRPTGNNERIRDKEVKFSDVPKEAVEAVNNLIHGGILVNTEDGKLNGEEIISMKEAVTLTRRIYKLFGTNLKDDFYQAVNRKELETRKIPAGQAETGQTSDVEEIVNKQVNTLLKEIVSGSGYPEGSMEKKIQDFYHSAVDMQTRNKLGAEPIRKYLDALDQAKNLSELSTAQITSLKEVGSGGLFSFLYWPDPKDNKKQIGTVMSAIDAFYSKEEYSDPKNEMINANNQLYQTLLQLSGESKEKAEAHIKGYVELLKKLAEYNPAQEEYSDPEKANKLVTMKELQEMLPGVDVEGMIQAQGGKSMEEVNIQMPQIFKGYCRLITAEENLEAVKTGMKLGLLTENYKNLSQDFIDAFDHFNQTMEGRTPDESTPEETAYALTREALGEYIDKLYAEHYFSEEAKRDVEKMVHNFIEVYKERIEKLDWMSEKTKKEAIAKLDNMKFVIGYPDQWEGTLDNLEVTDNYFQNAVAVQKNTNKAMTERALKGEKDGSIRMGLGVTTVNAAYNRFTNVMSFPAGILQAPNYDVNASPEENLGSMGAVIAHEISHAFDDQGAKYDVNGDEKDWWTKEDYEKFTQKCEAVKNFYDGWEAAPGITANGTQTLAENVADIGGVACTLEVLKKIENPDYDKFFRAYTRMWLKCTTRQSAVMNSESDEHSPYNLRVNRVLSNFQEFYDTYNIKEGDGMYVPVEERVAIW